ncbi:alanine dehydrogenase [Puteibacter caeruleilacunae]|nr:alanine dehydrogenase [Puteibacter caeruleilacunae]
MKIGLIREGKVPPDKRVPLSPDQCVELLNRYDDLEIVVQSSPIRCFKDEDYLEKGIPVTSEVSDCDILMGVKEVRVEDLIPDKTYLFFSHTIKKQHYNQKLLQTIVQKGIRLIDYETLVDDKGLRIIGFGRYAGLVGAYNGLLAYGKRYNYFHLKPAHLCEDLAEMKRELDAISLPPLRIAVTGGGRVAHGVMEILDYAGIKKIMPQDYQDGNSGDVVYVQLEPGDYNQRKDHGVFDLEHFYKNPGDYESTFHRYIADTDLLISAAYWDPQAPLLFTNNDMQEEHFSIKVIADITCDINGSIPTTQRASSIADPIYDFNPHTLSLEPPFNGNGNITVMAVDNLPCELPKDASIGFGNDLIERVIPGFLNNDQDGVLRRAAITVAGELTPRFTYLQDFVEG